MLTPSGSVRDSSRSRSSWRRPSAPARRSFRRRFRLVWEIDPEARTVQVYTAAASPDRELTGADTLDEGEVLPGFTLTVADLFAELDRQG